MKTPSQRSFGARIDRAEKFHQRLLTFSGFEPGDESLTARGYRALIDSIKQDHAQHHATRYAFLEAAKKRARAFTTNPDSFQKVATKVRSYTRGKFGRDSHEFTSIVRLVNKMRGPRRISLRSGAGEDAISRSETSYGAQLVNFEDMVAAVAGFGPGYAPANDAIKLPQLLAHAQNGASLNNGVAAKYALHKPTIAKRQNAFAGLEERSTRIKDMVKSQYGQDSPEYRLIKGLNFSL